jgi:uncharacterized cupin superfamily protein
VSTSDNPITPIRFEAGLVNGIGLDRMKAWPSEMVLRGVEPSEYKTWFEGQISAMVYAPQDGLLRFEGTTYDELVVVLHGRTILTPENGTPQHYGVGDSFVCPQGYRGTWEFIDTYRELIVFETRALREVMKQWNLSP